MSFALDDQPDSEIDENQQGANGVAQAETSGSNQTDVSLGGGGSGVMSAGGGNVGGSNQSAQSQAAKPSSSGSWTNLQSYLDANSDQGGKMGSQIASSVSNQAQKSQDDVNQATSDFSGQVNANTVNSDSNAVNQAITDATSAKAGSQLNSDDVSNFGKQANASYNGPTDFTKDQYYGQSQQDIDQAQKSLSQTGSESGRKVLLQNQYNGASENGYNQGEQNLDQLLLENSGGGKAALEPLQSQWSGLGSLLSNATQAQNAAAQQAVTTDQATAKAAQDALAAASGKFQGDLNSGYSAAKTGASTAYSQALSDLKSGTLTADEAKVLGLSNGETLFNVDPTHYLTPGQSPTLYNYATADQYAQAAALAKLAGQNDSTFLPGEYASQAGTAPAAYGFNADQFKSDIGAAKAAFQGTLNETYNGYTMQDIMRTGNTAQETANYNQLASAINNGDAATAYNLLNQQYQQTLATPGADKNIVTQRFAPFLNMLGNYNHVMNVKGAS